MLGKKILLIAMGSEEYEPQINAVFVTILNDRQIAIVFH